MIDARRAVAVVRAADGTVEDRMDSWKTAAAEYTRGDSPSPSIHVSVPIAVVVAGVDGNGRVQPSHDAVIALSECASMTMTEHARARKRARLVLSPTMLMLMLGSRHVQTHLRLRVHRMQPRLLLPARSGPATVGIPAALQAFVVHPDP